MSLHRDDWIWVVSILPSPRCMGGGGRPVASAVEVQHEPPPVPVGMCWGVQVLSPPHGVG